VAYLQVSQLGGTRDETWWGQGIRKYSVSWNLPKLSQLWLCNGGFGPSTTQNHLWMKQFMSGTRNSSRVAACMLQNKQAGWGHQPRLLSVCEKLLQEPSEVNTSCKPGIMDAPVKCVEHSVQMSLHKRILAACPVYICSFVLETYFCYVVCHLKTRHCVMIWPLNVKDSKIILYLSYIVITWDYSLLLPQGISLQYVKYDKF
jgi:hypothetical protein